MTAPQATLLGLLALLFGLLVWGRVRYDVVAFGGLLAAHLLGLVPTEKLFSGFGHPATVIVALVLVVSLGLVRSGVVDALARRVVDARRSLPAHVGIMSALAAALSAVMNNVAALALLMPIDLRAAEASKRSPALSLMPLSFATILGGMVTLIGTPPNVVIATFRADALGEAYGMLAFAPVGLAVALAGVTFVSLVGWRLLPADRSRRNTPSELLEEQGYVAELTLAADSELAGKSLADLRARAEEAEAEVIAAFRRGRRLTGSAKEVELRGGDTVVLHGGPRAIERLSGATGLRYAGDQGGVLGEVLEVVEVVVPKGARIEGRTAGDSRLSRRGVTLLGVSRRGRRFGERVRKLTIRAGDVLLLLGPREALDEVVEWLGCLPLAPRGLQVAQRDKAWPAAGLFALAVLAASFELVYLAAALGAVVVVYALARIVPLTRLYEAVEWPVVVLLASLIPIGQAFESTGCSDLAAQAILGATAGLPTAAVLGLLMVVTMTLSDVLNNVATALIAAPVALRLAERLDARPDAFLMAVAVAASCAFLTPIGHKNNTIVMGPGGYSFGDYWRMGLPLEILVVAIGLPAILWVWPL